MVRGRCDSSGCVGCSISKEKELGVFEAAPCRRAHPTHCLPEACKSTSIYTCLPAAARPRTLPTATSAHSLARLHAEPSAHIRQGLMQHCSQACLGCCNLGGCSHRDLSRHPCVQAASQSHALFARYCLGRVFPTCSSSPASDRTLAFLISTPAPAAEAVPLAWPSDGPRALWASFGGPPTQHRIRHALPGIIVKALPGWCPLSINSERLMPASDELVSSASVIKSSNEHLWCFLLCCPSCLCLQSSPPPPSLKKLFSTR